MMVAIALLLAACGGKESKEDVVNSIKEKVDEVEKYHTEMIIDIKVLDESDTVTDKSEGILKVTMNEKTLESTGEMIQDTEKITYYSTEEATYAQENDFGWEDMTAYEDDFKHTETNYESVAKIISDLKDEEDVEMEEEDGKFVFSFTGKNSNVFKALEKPYTLTLPGVDTEDVEHDLTITVDSETYYIEQLTNKMSATLDGEKAEILIDHTYDQINEIDDIVIPQEVIDEAEALEAATNEPAEKEEEKEEDKNETDSSNEEEQTRIFEMEQPGILTTMTYYYKGDNVTKQGTENVIDYDGLGLTSKEEAQEIFDPEIAKMQGIDGVTHEMEYTDTQAVEKLMIDYENLDFEAAKDMPGLELSGDYENGISMEASAQILLEQGFIEK